MSLILPQTVDMMWTGRSKKPYTKLGYPFTKIGDIFQVDVLDLPNNSNKPVLVQCDFCKRTKPLAYSSFNKATNNNTMKYGCKECSLARAIAQYENVTKKTCKKCGETKELGEFGKVKSGNPRSTCKVCRKKEQIKKAVIREIQMEGTQVCKECDIEKRILEFNVVRNYINGRNTICKICQAKHKQRRRKKHRDSLTIEFFNDRAASLNNAPRSMEIYTIVTGEDLQAIFLKQEEKCNYCCTTLDGSNIQFDHTLPISRGGAHSHENIRACCFACNRLKLNRTEAEFRVFLDDYTSRVLKKWG